MILPDKQYGFRITHVPTGTVVEQYSHRWHTLFDYRVRAKLLSLLKSKLWLKKHPPKMNYFYYEGEDTELIEKQITTRLNTRV